MGLEYLDLYLIHWPVAFAYNKDGDFYPQQGKNMPVPLTETWHAMQELVEDGLARHIGVSNFDIAQLAELSRHPKTTIRPAVNQIEVHPYLRQPKLVKYCQQKGIVIEGYSPLGSTPSPDAPNLLADPVVLSLAEKYSTSPASVLLRYQLDLGFIVLPRSQNANSIRENLLAPLAFSLSEEDMALLKTLHRDHRFVAPSWHSFSPIN